MILLYTTKASKARTDILAFCEENGLELEERRLGLADDQYIPTVEDVQNLMKGMGTGYAPKANPYDDDVTQLLKEKKVAEYGEEMESLRVIELAWWLAENKAQLRDYFLYDTQREITCVQFGAEVQGVLRPRSQKLADIESTVIGANLLRELDVFQEVSPILGE